MENKSRLNVLMDFYEAEHQNAANRWTHHLAHIIASIGVIFCFSRPLLGVVLILAALPFSWLGHFFFERNVPAFFDMSDKGGVAGGLKKKIYVAAGGVLWSFFCFLRLFNAGPLRAGK